jgi:hypothetical protein
MADVDVVEVLAGETPVVGSVLHAGLAGGDLGKSWVDKISGDEKGFHDSQTDMLINMAEMIPGVGTGLEMAEVSYDQEHGEDATRDKVKSWIAGGEMDDSSRYEQGRKDLAAARPIESLVSHSAQPG